MTAEALLILLSFYAQHTGKPAYTLLADNWGQRHDLGYAWREHQIQYGDLNLDGVTDSKDLWIYGEVMNEIAGWAVNTDTAHCYLDCYQLKRSVKTPTMRVCKRYCLTCAARKVSECQLK
jgi:hypothetical protein